MKDRTSIPLEKLSPEFRPGLSVPVNGTDLIYSVLQIADQDDVTYPEILDTVKVFRANCYIDELHYLPEEARLEDGTETDQFDEQSVHFTVLEHDITRHGVSRVVGCIRGIKRRTNNKLPVETMFPDIFSDDQAPIGATEASRFISRHPDPRVQLATSLRLIRALVAHSAHHGGEPIYALVELPLARYFEKIGLPVEYSSEPRPIKAYNNTENLVLKFLPHEIIARAETSHGSLYRYFNNSNDTGLGFYGADLLKPIKMGREDGK